MTWHSWRPSDRSCHGTGRCAWAISSIVARNTRLLAHSPRVLWTRTSLSLCVRLLRLALFAVAYVRLFLRILGGRTPLTRIWTRSAPLVGSDRQRWGRPRKLSRDAPKVRYGIGQCLRGSDAASSWSRLGWIDVAVSACLQAKPRTPLSYPPIHPHSSTHTPIHARTHTNSTLR